MVGLIGEDKQHPLQRRADRVDTRHKQMDPRACTSRRIRGWRHSAERPAACPGPGPCPLRWCCNCAVPVPVPVRVRVRVRVRVPFAFAFLSTLRLDGANQLITPFHQRRDGGQPLVIPLGDAWFGDQIREKGLGRRELVPQSIDDVDQFLEEGL